MSARFRLVPVGVMLLGLTGAAQAQTHFDFRYDIAVAGISIGRATWSGAIGADQYTTSASGSASGLIKVLLSGTGEVKVDGVIKDGRPVPTLFVSILRSDEETSQFTMKLDNNGTVKELAATDPPPSDDHVIITEAHKQGVTDPLSAMIIPTAGGEPTRDTCTRQMAVFDGRRRFDLRLAYKRMDRVKADRGYAGPVVVCTLTFHPLAGYRLSSSVIRYLAEGRDMELWLAPIAHTRLAAPFRLSIANVIGNMTIEATQFEATAAAAVAPKR
jgi:hypothetical protein